MSETSFNLISEKCDILSILRDHPENRIYQRKIQELSKRFTGIRKTKGDGNCFYRALGYSYLESLLGKSREVLKFKERVLQTPNDLLAAGFEEHKFRNFFNAFYSVVELVEKDGSVSSLLKVFNDQSSSDQIVQFLRLLTSAFIKNRADFFRHFIDEEMDIKDFCTHEVEPMAMECDHIQITALSQALNIALQPARGGCAHGVGLHGLPRAGIAASSLVAKMKSSAAIAKGGGVATGSLVATLQSVGKCPWQALLCRVRRTGVSGPSPDLSLTDLQSLLLCVTLPVLSGRCRGQGRSPGPGYAGFRLATRAGWLGSLRIPPTPPPPNPHRSSAFLLKE
uniref:ubiquitinyl hydrolase 1 n=1 Tax=Canis lupus familiaris TaxID=9615 RepID=A0A8C0N1Z2_CANLF